MSLISTFCRLRMPALAAATAMLTLPASALAQACIGSSALPGQFSIGGGLSFQDGATGYALGSRANLDGPIGFGAELGIIDVEDVDSNMTTLAIDGSWDLPVEGLDACPVAGFSYATWNESFGSVDVDVSALSFPVGMSVGTQLAQDGGSATFIPNARAGLFHQRLSVSASEGSSSVSESDSDTKFFFGGGMTIAFGQFYGKVGVSHTTIEDADPVFSVGMGIVF